MSHEELARVWRFTTSDDILIQCKEIFEYFKKRFDTFGGMTVEISKKIGW